MRSIFLALVFVACSGPVVNPCSVEGNAVTCHGDGHPTSVELEFADGYTASLKHYVTRDGVNEYTPSYGATYHSTIGGPFRVKLDAPAFRTIQVRIEPKELIDTLSDVRLDRR